MPGGRNECREGEPLPGRPLLGGRAELIPSGGWAEPMPAGRPVKEPMKFVRNRRRKQGQANSVTHPQIRTWGSCCTGAALGKNESLTSWGGIRPHRFPISSRPAASKIIYFIYKSINPGARRPTGNERANAPQGSQKFCFFPRGAPVVSSSGVFLCSRLVVECFCAKEQQRHGCRCRWQGLCRRLSTRGWINHVTGGHLLFKFVELRNPFNGEIGKPENMEITWN